MRSILTSHLWTVALPTFLVAAAAVNAVLGFLNSKRNYLSICMLITGLLTAAAVGYLFVLNYNTAQFLKASAVLGVGGR
jgi:hypothetical protein